MAGPLAAPWALAALVLVLPAPVGWYATHVEPNRLTVDRVTVPVDGARAGDDPVRIGVLSDLQTNHVGPHEHAAVDRLLAEEPELILVPGDLFQGSRAMFAGQESSLRTLLARLHEIDGNAIYVSNGVGLERAQAPQVRLFSTPSVGVISLVDGPG
jgi:predicted MPP superfamily phosphohydrolase